MTMVTMLTWQAQPATPDDRATSFQAVPANQAEQYSGGTLLVAAYAALWIVLFAWVAVVWRKQAALHERLADLEKVIDKASTARDKAAAREDAPRAARDEG
jgi:CcmD family protein